VDILVVEGGPAGAACPLQTTVNARGADKAKVEEAAAAAKAGCPISKLLKLEIALEPTVVAQPCTDRREPC
jgi:osmotically inducible protein OsmC